MSEHKSCPFCGGEPEPHSYISTKNFVLCALCRNGTAMYEKMSDAWEVWDRRDDAAVKELVEAAKELSDLMRDIMTGDYKPDSLTLQPIEQAINKVEGL